MPGGLKSAAGIWSVVVLSAAVSTGRGRRTQPSGRGGDAAASLLEEATQTAEAIPFVPLAFHGLPLLGAADSRGGRHLAAPVSAEAGRGLAGFATGPPGAAPAGRGLSGGATGPLAYARDAAERHHAAAGGTPGLPQEITHGAAPLVAEPLDGQATRTAILKKLGRGGGGGHAVDILGHLPDDWAAKVRAGSVRVVHIGEDSVVMTARLKGASKPQVAFKVMRSTGAGAEDAIRELAFARSNTVFWHVAVPHDFRIVKGNYVTLMPAADMTLADLLRSKSGIPMKQSFQLLYDMLHALLELKRRCITHNNVTPENVLIIEGHAVLSDLGKSKWTRDRADFAADMNAVGKIFETMLLGEDAEEQVRELEAVTGTHARLLVGMREQGRKVFEPITAIKEVRAVASRLGFEVKRAIGPTVLPDLGDDMPTVLPDLGDDIPTVLPDLGDDMPTLLSDLGDGMP